MLRTTEQHGSRAIAIVLLICATLSRASAQAQKVQAADTSIPVRHVVVSIAHRELALIEDGKVLEVYPVAVGSASTPSPTGTFQIRTRLVRPAYYHPGIIVPPGPGNPLGTRWIGLNAQGYGIHGTSLESSIGKAASHGCIRMHRRDLEQLFAMVRVGDEVEIRDGSDAELASIFGALPNRVGSTEPAAMIAVNGQ
jgi:lipoprotein-anchoring transpeptidase ErfK/SrfK